MFPWFVVTYVREYTPKIVVGESHYSVGKKFCRRYECYFITKKIFCQCCGMQLRATPTEKKLKERQNMKKDRKRKLVSKPS